MHLDTLLLVEELLPPRLTLPLLALLLILVDVLGVDLVVVGVVVRVVVGISLGITNRELGKLSWRLCCWLLGILLLLMMILSWIVGKL